MAKFQIHKMRTNSELLTLIKECKQVKETYPKDRKIAEVDKINSQIEKLNYKIKPVKGE